MSANARLATTGLVRQRYLQRLGLSLLLHTALHHSLSWNRYAYFGILAEALPAIATLDGGALLPRSPTPSTRSMPGGR